MPRKRVVENNERRIPLSAGNIQVSEDSDHAKA